MLAGSAWASAAVVNASLGPFDSPYAPASVNHNTQVAAATFPSEARALRAFVAKVPQNQAADVLETSGLTGFYIMATGREFLPVGGFTGHVPAPSLSEFTHLVAEGRIARVTVTTKPLDACPDLLWVVSHCIRTPESAYDAVEQATRTIYTCLPHPRSVRVPVGPPSLRGAPRATAVGRHD